MKLLFVDCCISVHGDQSRTRRLADAFLTEWKSAHPNDEVEVVDVKNMDLRPLNAQDAIHRDEAVAAGKLDDASLKLAQQFAAADRIVIAAPFWELSFPAQLRVYIEHVSTAGITFVYTDHGSEGACKAGKMLFLCTAGGPLEGCNRGSEHLQSLCGMFGIQDYQFLGAPFQDVIEMDHESLLVNVIAQAKELAKTF